MFTKEVVPDFIYHKGRVSDSCHVAKWVYHNF